MVLGARLLDDARKKESVLQVQRQQRLHQARASRVLPRLVERLHERLGFCEPVHVQLIGRVCRSLVLREDALVVDDGRILLLGGARRILQIADREGPVHVRRARRSDGDLEVGGRSGDMVDVDGARVEAERLPEGV